MKTYSNYKPDIYVVSAQELRVHWNIQEVPAPSIGSEERMQWEANEALCSIFDSRSQLIEKIIGSVYDTGTEIATINNQVDKPEAYAEYQAFRTIAKELADGWLTKG
jgi:predicted Mrr-cat superfamily restriction endonuclease